MLFGDIMIARRKSLKGASMAISELLEQAALGRQLGPEMRAASYLQDVT